MGGGSQRRPDADLLSALAYRIRDNRIQTDGSQQQRRSTKHHEQNGEVAVQLVDSPHSRDPRIQRHEMLVRYLEIHIVKLTLKCDRESFWRHASSGENP